MNDVLAKVAQPGPRPLRLRPRVRWVHGLDDMPPLPLLRGAWHGLWRGLALVRPRAAPVVHFGPERATRGPVLVARPVFPAALDVGEPSPGSPVADWSTVALVRTLLERGHPVDVADERAIESVPRRQYEVFVGGARALAALARGLPGDCRRILHCDGPDPLFQNAAELSRLAQLKDRRGVVLPPVRHQLRPPSYHGVAAALVEGNEATLETFAGCPVPLYRLPRAAVRQDRPPPHGKDVAACRRRFLWLGTRGLVHQGLDRVLEAFAGLEGFHLTVVAPLAGEPHFASAYARELYRSPNIEVLGDLPLHDARLDAVARGCVGLVLPTAAEGQSPEVVEALALGLIPVVSREAGVDVAGFGFELQTCSPDEIQETIRVVADLPPDDLASRARHAWTWAREHHSRDAVARAYRAALDRILTS